MSDKEQQLVEYTEQLDITPETNMIEGLQAGKLSLAKSLIEVIDNSLDAGASVADVTVTGKYVQVKDDGCGVHSMAAAFRLGKHQQHATTKSGRYGFGLKGAGLSFGGSARVTTLRDDSIATAVINWAEQARSGKWSISCTHKRNTPDMRTRYDLPEVSGTTVVFSGLDLEIRDFGRVLRDIGYQFTPGLRSGKRIEITLKGKPVPVSPMEFPPLLSRVEHTGSINGKAFSVVAGVVPDGTKNVYQGFNFAKAHRIVKRSNDGCGDIPVLQFFGYVELGEGWALTTYKEDVADSDFESLCDQLESLCAEPLRVASEKSQFVELCGIESDVTDALNGMFGIKREKRNQAENHGGTNTPTGRNGKRANATKTQEGNGSVNGSPEDEKKKSKQVRGIAMVFGDLKDGALGELAECSATSKKNVMVVLNKEHPCVVASMKNKEALTVIAAVAVAEFAQTHDNKDLRQALLKGVREDNQQTVIAIMSDLLREQGQADRRGEQRKRSPALV